MDMNSPYLEYQKAWRDRWNVQKRTLDELKIQMRISAKLCANYLADHFHVTQVFLFGSLANSRPVHEHSDIDLAVDGLASEVYFQALTALYALIPRGKNLDLIPLENISRDFRSWIEQNGEQLV